MQGWTQLDAASVIAIGTLVALFGLSGVLGYLPFRTLNSRNLAKLRERVPLFRTWTDEKYFAVQGWAFLVLGLHIIVVGIVLLLRLRT